MRRFLLSLTLLFCSTYSLAQIQGDSPSRQEKRPEFGSIVYRSMPHEKVYPRVEVYVADPSGQGIDRQTYLLDPEQADALLKSQLRFLPDFGEEKPSISLQHYVEMSLLTTNHERVSLFPRSLDGYQSASDQGARDLATVADFHRHAPERLEIVWLDETTWFVNDVFYRLELGNVLENALSQIRDEKLMEVSMAEFMTDSHVVSRKINENLSHLSLDPRRAYHRDETLLFSLSLSPGMPGTSHYHFKIYTDGVITSAGQSYSPFHRGHRLSHHQVVSFTKALRSLHLDRDSEQMAPPFVHDGQSETLQVYLDHRNTTLSFGPGGPPKPDRVRDFMTDALRFLSHVQLESQR